MSYEPRDTYLPSARGGAQVPQFVGQREEAARSYATSAGWTIHVRHVPPSVRNQPDGFVVGQEPTAGSIAPAGAVLAVDVSRRPGLVEQYGRPLRVGATVALAIASFAFASLWLEARQDARDRSSGASEAAARLAEAETRIAELEEQVTAAAAGDGELTLTLQAQLDEANRALAQATAQVDDLTAQLTEGSSVSDSDAAGLADLESERDDLLARVAELEARLGGMSGDVVATPDWIGQQQVAVEEFVRAQGLELTVETVDGAETAAGDPVPAGTVLVQSPLPGVPLVRGSAVVVTVVAPTSPVPAG